MKFIFTTVTLFISLHLFAQQSNITGTIRAGGEVTGAIVTLIKAADSSVVKTNLCEANGSFVFSNVMAGSYLLSISHVGYIRFYTKPFTVATNQQLPLEAISLVAALTITSYFGFVLVDTGFFICIDIQYIVGHDQWL